MIQDMLFAFFQFIVFFFFVRNDFSIDYFNINFIIGHLFLFESYNSRSENIIRV